MASIWANEEKTFWRGYYAYACDAKENFEIAGIRFWIKFMLFYVDFAKICKLSFVFFSPWFCLLVFFPFAYQRYLEKCSYGTKQVKIKWLEKLNGFFLCFIFFAFFASVAVIVCQARIMYLQKYASWVKCVAKKLKDLDCIFMNGAVLCDWFPNHGKWQTNEMRQNQWSAQQKRTAFYVFAKEQLCSASR